MILFKESDLYDVTHYIQWNSLEFYEIVLSIKDRDITLTRVVMVKLAEHYPDPEWNSVCCIVVPLLFRPG